ncbi:MAG: SHOCT domain-containing protein [Clostridia bacterium]|nr:SHOCT domain-containing protein [Clostridia bacterium]
MEDAKTCVFVFLVLSLVSLAVNLGLGLLFLPAILRMGTGFGINWTGLALYFMLFYWGFVVLPPVLYHLSTWLVLRKATKPSDVSVVRKLLGFVFGVIIVGILLCSLQDKDFEQGRGALPVQNNYTALMQYKRMLDDGLISTSDYQAKKALLLK